MPQVLKILLVALQHMSSEEKKDDTFFLRTFGRFTNILNFGRMLWRLIKVFRKFSTITHYSFTSPTSKNKSKEQISTTSYHHFSYSLWDMLPTLKLENKLVKSTCKYFSIHAVTSHDFLVLIITFDILS